MALLDQQAEALLRVLPQADAFLTELQQAVVMALQEGEPTLEQIATKRGQSTRSLYRRLQARGLTYKAVLGDPPLELARGYLADATLSLPEIAPLPGYSQQSAFTRAVQYWGGETPFRTHQP